MTELLAQEGTLGILYVNPHALQIRVRAKVRKWLGSVMLGLLVADFRLILELLGPRLTHFRQKGGGRGETEKKFETWFHSMLKLQIIAF